MKNTLHLLTILKHRTCELITDPGSKDRGKFRAMVGELLPFALEELSPPKDELESNMVKTLGRDRVICNGRLCQKFEIMGPGEVCFPMACDRAWLVFENQYTEQVQKFIKKLFLNSVHVKTTFRTGSYNPVLPYCADGVQSITLAPQCLKDPYQHIEIWFNPNPRVPEKIATSGYDLIREMDEDLGMPYIDSKKLDALIAILDTRRITWPVPGIVQNDIDPILKMFQECV